MKELVNRGKLNFMSKIQAILVVLSTFSLSLAETLTPEVNKVAYDYAVAMFEAADVTVAECSPEQKARAGFFYLCGKTGLGGEAFEGAWTPASAAYGATDGAGVAITGDAWSLTGNGNQGLAVYVDGEFIIGQYGPSGDVSVQSGQVYDTP